MARTPTVPPQMCPFPSTEITDGHKSGQDVLLCHASDRNIASSVVSVGLALCNWR